MADSKLSALSELSVPSLEDLLYTVDDPSGTPASAKVSATRFLGQLNHVCQGRLTLESGVAVSTTDQTAKTNVYFTPYGGQCVSLYDGTRWRMYTFTELTLALGTITDAKNYDVFLYDNAGTLTLELLAWTDDTTRATALALTNGVNLKTGALTRRYVGTFRTTSTTTTEDSGGGGTTQVGGKRFLFNAQNQVHRWLKVIDTADSWSYTTAGWRQARGATSPLNAVEYVAGLAETLVQVNVIGEVFVKNSSAQTAGVGLGIDNTTPVGIRNAGYFFGVVDNAVGISAAYSGYPGLGYHALNWIEHGGDGNSLFAGDDSGLGEQTGLLATIVM